VRHFFVETHRLGAMNTGVVLMLHRIGAAIRMQAYNVAISPDVNRVTHPMVIRDGLGYCPLHALERMRSKEIVRVRCFRFATQLR
jgi:hypothetical protein